MASLAIATAEATKAADQAEQLATGLSLGHVGFGLGSFEVQFGVLKVWFGVVLLKLGR